MNEAIIRTTDSSALVAGPSEFSWRAVIAGAFVASAVIFFLLFLGTGIGLSLFTVPRANPANSGYGLTLGAIYFFTAQAFGLGVGGYIAGRLMGPVLESRDEEIFHSSAHGLVTWALAVLMTVTMVAISGLVLAGSGLNAAAILGATNQTTQTSSSASDPTGYWVDMLFRPTASIAPSNLPAPVAANAVAAASPLPGRTVNEARAEAGRILGVGVLHGEKLTQADHDQLAILVSQFTGADIMLSNQRVDDVQNRMHEEVIAAAEEARKFTRFVSLWLAASLIFGALAASGIAVVGRWVDDDARMSAI